MARHWCHICNSFVHVQQNPMSCATCGGEFVEVVPDEPHADAHQEEQIDQDDAFGPQIPIDANNPLGSLFGMISNMLANPAQNGPYGFGQPPAPGQPQQHVHFTFQPQFAAPNAQVPRAGQNMPPNAQPAFVQLGQFPMFNFGAQGGSLQDLLGGLMMPQQMGDYVSDAGMQGLLDRLFRQHQSSQVPASKSIFDRLPTVKFTEETATGECAICKCDWEKGDEAVDLPCHHYFHKDCIKKWFETSNLCPMCRHELPTDDPEYEEKRKAKQEEQDKLRTSQRSGTPSSQTQQPNSSSSSASTSTTPSTTQSGGRPNSAFSPSAAAMNQDISITSAPSIDLTSSDEDIDYEDAYDSKEFSDDHISLSSSEGDSDENSMDVSSSDVVTISDDEEQGPSAQTRHNQRRLRRATNGRSPSVHDPGLDVD